MSTHQLPEIVPAPWTLHAESWAFPFWNTAAGHQRAAGASTSSSPLSPGSYHPAEKITDGDRFVGGPGFWYLFRYTDSPVGPYDELILVAGVSDSPTAGKALRITNIYVSTDESLVSGRSNWNIPKHKARFEFSEKAHSSSTDAQSVQVYHPEDAPFDSEQPFFSARLQSSRYCPNIPINTTYSWLPPLLIYQPALLRSEVYPADSERAAVNVATKEPVFCAPKFRGSCHLAYLSPLPGQDSFGDGVSFPRLPAGPHGVGIHFTQVQVIFPEADKVDASGKRVKA